MSEPLIDEQTFTPHAATGWLSWDGWSPEQDFCRFAGMLQRLVQPSLTVETGVGIGRITSHLDMACGTYLGFEASAEWRQSPAEPDRETPSVEELAAADLVILDSHPPHRQREFAAWAEIGKSGSVCLMHDCGNGHRYGSLHAELHALCVNSGIPGLFLRNPRGSWLGLMP